MYRVGIDLGGTNIVAGVVNDAYEIVATAKCKTRLPRPSEEIVMDIARMAKEAVEKAGLTMDDIAQVGVGSPGTCNVETGIVEYANNLRFDKVPLRDMLEGMLGKKVYIENDANAAALGEALAGRGQGRAELRLHYAGHRALAAASHRRQDLRRLQLRGRGAGSYRHHGGRGAVHLRPVRLLGSLRLRHRPYQPDPPRHGQPSGQRHVEHRGGSG